MAGLTVTVCGGGNAAHVAAGMYSHQGAKVNLFFSFEDEAKRFREGMAKNPKGKGVTVEMAEGKSYTALPNVISHKPEEVIPEADLILIIVPAFAHEPILTAIKPHLKERTCVGAVPGPGGFDLLAQHVLGDVIKEKSVVLFGGSSLPWACRFEDYGSRVSLLGIKSSGDVSVKPNNEECCKLVAERLNAIHHDTVFATGANFLVTTLWPTNCIIHTGVTYGLWHDWDGSPVKEAPLFYQNCSETTGEILDGLSNDILATKAGLEKALNIDLHQLVSLFDYITKAYSHCIDDKTNTASAFRTNHAFRGLRAPMKTRDDGLFEPNFNTRYLTEDLPHGLAVLRGIAELAGVETPTFDKVLLWEQEKIGKKYLVDGKIAGPDVAASGCPQRYGITDPKGLL